MTSCTAVGNDVSVKNMRLAYTTMMMSKTPVRLGVT